MLADCVLYAVGKPVYLGSSNHNNNGCWMRDPDPVGDKDAEKFWATQERDDKHLYQFDNKTVFRNSKPSRFFSTWISRIVLLMY